MIESALDAVICVDAKGRIMSVNGVTCDLLRCPEDQAVGRPAADLLRPAGEEHPLHDDIVRALDDQASAPRRVERTVVAADGTVQHVEASILATEFDGERIATLFLRDITETKRSEQRQAVEHRLARVLAAARSAGEVARGGLELVGAGLGFDHAELWFPDAAQATLRLGAAWRRDEEAPFAEASRHLTVARGEDLAGLAWEIGEAVCVDDASTLEGLVRAEAIAAEGIRGCAALPLRAGGGLVGVAVLARRGGAPLDAELRQTLHSIGVQIGHFAERRVAERRLAEETVALAAVARATRRLTGAVDDAAAQEAICEAALEISGARYAFLALPDPETGGLVVRSFAPRGPTAGSAADRRFSPTTPSAAMRAFETRRAVFLPDIADDPGADLERARAAGVVSGLVQPILREDEALGVLGLGWGTLQATLDRSTRLLVRLLAGEASMALTRVELVAKLESAARTDPLTGLANVRAWEEQLTRELAAAGRDGRAVAVAVLDLDGFKALNDRLGHQAGDRVLRTSAAAWQHQLREGDLLARLGGDEFGALLPGCAPDDAVLLAERLRAATDQVTASVGIAYWDREESLDDLMVRADGALYAAKAAGRDRISSG
jgi:diguanylate cyclase (GGDEF)-like protein/PAS domain S-box-containing protein